jgi:uncharacterized protein DUF6968
MTSGRVRTPSSAPQRISRVAARRVFQQSGKSRRPVTLTIGVPQPVPGSDWGCAVQVTGLDRRLSRPRFIFGIDALQALHLAMQFAGATLERSGYDLEWLGQKGDLGFPRFLPNLPQPQRDQLDRMIEREVTQFYAAAKRRGQSKTSGTPRRGTDK